MHIEGVRFWIEFQVLPSSIHKDKLICKLEMRYGTGVRCSARDTMKANESLVEVLARILPNVSGPWGWYDHTPRDIEIAQKKLRALITPGA